MNANTYVDQILRKYEVDKRPGTAVHQAGERLRGLVQSHYRERLVGVQNSGSFAKNTSIKGGTDLDLFISLKPRSGKNLKSIFDGLYSFASREKLNPRRQNVSIGVQVSGVKVDLVPARKHSGKSDHSLFLNRTGGWTVTNVDKHIGLVRNSGKSPAIRAAKIWRTNHGLDFPSFYLEIAVIHALKGKGSRGTGDELVSVLEFLSGGFPQAKFTDPANQANVISSDLTAKEKQEISKLAQTSLVKVRNGQWANVLW